MSLGPLHVVKQSNKLCSGAVIFLHGSGDTGQGVLNWVKFLVGDNFSLPHVKFLFPTAPLRPYTPLRGELSHVWFDRLDITPEVPEHEETLNSVGGEINKIIEDVVKSGVPLDRIIVGGFSMGGALALHTGYRYTPGLPGVFTLSSFLNKNSLVYKELKSKETKLFMCHGDRDTLVPIEWGIETYKELDKLGIDVNFNRFKNTMHELKKREILDLFEWIQTIIPPLPNDN
ncbi:unnamed protein product [Brassicogethes aeneus]|uniref:palmitoyl-protein hydrolase n=1 Tax=Brassicogethes aeneus TaxID=1431903 RepID=A0A9P0BBN5_BRAAE|nr:unnamed protein product [Brassicogethes aeneus]